MELDLERLGSQLRRPLGSGRSGLVWPGKMLLFPAVPRDLLLEALIDTA